MPKTSEKTPSRLVRISEGNYNKLLAILSDRQKNEKNIISLTQVTNEELDKSLKSYDTIN